MFDFIRGGRDHCALVWAMALTCGALAQFAGAAPGQPPVSYDFDGDEVEDRVVGYAALSDVGPVLGLARVYRGTNLTPRLNLLSGKPNDAMGTAVAAAGDLNADGLGDVVVSAPYFSGTHVRSGAVRVFSGLNGALLATFEGGPFEMLGRAVAGVGDVTGDGVPDLAMSGVRTLPDGSRRGFVQIRSSGDASPLVVIESLEPNDRFGASIVGVSDLNADGLNDFVIGCPTALNAGASSGGLYIFHGVNCALGCPVTLTSADAQSYHPCPIAADASYDAFAQFLLNGVDQNDDGVPELLVVSRGRDIVQQPGWLIDSISVATGQTVLREWTPTLVAPGDANGDGETGAGDAGLVLGNYGSGSSPFDSFSGDGDGDGSISIGDLYEVVTNFDVVSPLHKGAASLAAAVAVAAGQPPTTEEVACFGIPWAGEVIVPVEDDDAWWSNVPPLLACCRDPSAGHEITDGWGHCIDFDAGDVTPNPGDGTAPPDTWDGGSIHPPGGGGGGGGCSCPGGGSCSCLLRIGSFCVLQICTGETVIIYPDGSRLLPDGTTEIKEPPRQPKPNPRGGPGGPGPGGGGNGFNPTAASGDNAEASVSNPELDRNGPGESTCNPVVLSEGIKTEENEDLRVALPGTDFVLTRTYSTADTEDNGFPYMLGRGWGTSADGWALFAPSKVTWTTIEDGTFNPFEDGIEVVAFPLEGSSKFFKSGSDPNRFDALAPDYAHVWRTTATVRGVVVPVWLYERAGVGQTIYYRTSTEENHGVPLPDGLRVLNGRILQQRDPFGTAWTHEYTMFFDDGGRPTRPRLSRIYLDGEREADCAAYVQFDWDVGTDSNTGRCAGAAAFRRVAEGFVEIARVNYVYAQQFWAIYGSQVPLANYADHLVAVVQSARMDPIEGSSEPLWYSRATHYRYLAVVDPGDEDTPPKPSLLTHVFGPEQVERFAELWAQGSATQSQSSRIVDAPWQMMQIAVGTEIPGGPRLDSLATKIVSYYTKHDFASGYAPGDLTGMVKQEIVQHGCACSGLNSTRIDFQYVRGGILEPPMPPAPISGVEIKPVRATRLTVRTEYVAQDSTWVPFQRIRNWSEDRLFSLGWGVFGLPPSQQHGFSAYVNLEIPRWVPVPFVVANEVQELDPAGQPVRTWRTFFEFENHMPVRKFNAAAVESFDLRLSGLLNFRDRRQDPDAPVDPREAVRFVPGGRAEWTEFDELGRERRQGLAPIGADGDPLALVPIREQTYITTSSDLGTRPDLVAEVREFTTDAEDGPYERTLTSYELEEIEPLARPRVRAITTTEPRESAAENGPGGAQVARRISALNRAGDPVWSSAADGSLTVCAYDPNTGALTAKRRNAAVSHIPAGAPAGVQPPPDRSTQGGSLTMSRESDLLGRPKSIIDESGVRTDIEYTLSRFSTYSALGQTQSTPPLSQSRLPYLTIRSIPQPGAGPEIVEWASAGYNILRHSEYAPSDGRETARVIHQYTPQGLHAETRTWHDLAADLSYLDRFEYDSRGRLVRTISPGGQISETIYDCFDRAIETLQGVSPSTMKTVERMFYDHTGPLSNPQSGPGDGLLTLTQRFASDTDIRSTVHVYDWRNRKRFSFLAGADESHALPGSYTAEILDNQGRAVQSAVVRGGDLSSLITSLRNDALDSFLPMLISPASPIERVAETRFSARGLPYAQLSYFHTDDGSERSLRTDTWYDAEGRAITSVGPDGAVVKSDYDGLGRVWRSATTDGAAARTGSRQFTAVTDLEPANEVVFESSRTTFDARGLPVLALTQQRRHDLADSVKGIGGSPLSLFTATVYDDHARPIAAVKYGSGLAGGSASPAFAAGGVPDNLPLTAIPPRDPASGRIITETRYDDIGRATESIDPKGIVTRTRYDDLDRAVATIENATGTPADGVQLARESDGTWSVTNRPASEQPDQNRVTSLVYDAEGNITHRIAHVPARPDQTPGDRRQITQYLYSAAAADTLTGPGGPVVGEAISNRLLYQVRYPNPASGLPGSDPRDIVRYAYNRLGERLGTLDQNGTLIHYELDGAGRITAERAAGTPASRINFTLDTLSTTYDTLGRAETMSMSNGTTLVNQVALEYDGLGRMTRVAQNPLGAASDPAAAVVSYEYEDAAGQGLLAHDRLAAIVYPEWTTEGAPPRQSIFYGGLPGSPSDLISRITRFDWTAGGAGGSVTTLIGSASHAYLGLSRRVVSMFNNADGGTLARDRWVDADTGARDPGVYRGLDQFGRVKNQLWTIGLLSTNPTRPPLARLAYSYDDAGNILSRLDRRSSAATTSPLRDEHHRFDNLHRLVETARGTLATPRKGSERWTLDALGNWTVSERVTVSPSHGYDRIESREFNATNEITDAEVTSLPGTPNPSEPPEQRAFEYDDAGNLTAQRLPDQLNAQGDFQAQRWKVFTYDPWNRLVRVAVERRAGITAPPSGWPTKTLAAYTYYAGNQRATKTWRANRTAGSAFTDPDDDGEPPAPPESDPDPDAPNHRALYAYDRDWHLLEERVESGYAGSWDWGIAGLFWDRVPDSSARVNRYVWDPTQWDELVQFVSKKAQSALGGGVNVVEDERRWALTDRNHTVIGLIDAAAVTQATITGGGVAPASLQRNVYSPFGKAQREWLADVDGDGDVDADDVQKVIDGTGSSLGDPGYSADLDIDADGAIGASDLLHVTQAITNPPGPEVDPDDPFGAAGVEKNALWRSRCLIGYAGTLWDGHSALWLMRNRWYDPDLGTWITRDPAGYVDGMCLYRYVRGNPLVYFDPFGLQSECPQEGHKRPKQRKDDKEEEEDVTEGNQQERLAKKIHNRHDNYMHPDGLFNDIAVKDSSGRYRYTIRHYYDAQGNYLGRATFNADVLDEVLLVNMIAMRQKFADRAAAIAAALDAGIRIALPSGELMYSVMELAGEPSLDNLTNVATAGLPFIPGTIRNAKLAGKVHPKTGVPFKANGFPDFSKFAKGTVKIKSAGDRAADVRAANKAMGFDQTPPGFVWHHHEDGVTMQLVPEAIHSGTGHTGGVAMNKRRDGIAD